MISAYEEIPSIWRVWDYDPGLPGLTFTAEQANSTVRMNKGYTEDVSLEYSIDGSTWNDFIVGTTVVTLPSIGDKMCMRAKTTNSRMGYNGYYNTFVMTGKIAASNSIMYLLKKDGNQSYIPPFCFQSLFDRCTSLTKAPEIPATRLYNYCYDDMFRGCTSLTQAPSILPATTLATNCYYDMFRGCTSLTTAPDLPATELASNCYRGMFQGCTSLSIAPDLPATALATNCYYDMFNGCSSLNSIKIGYTGNFSVTYTAGWVTGVASTGTFYYNGSDTAIGSSAIPTGWTIQTF